MQINGYDFELDKAQKGQLFDLRTNTIESFAAEVEVPFGSGVKRGTDPEKQVVLADDDGFLGIAVFTHTEIEGLYPEKSVVSVLTKGAVYVESSVAGVTAGEKAYITDAGAFTNVEASNLEVGTFLSSAGENELVVLEI